MFSQHIQAFSSHSLEYLLFDLNMKIVNLEESNDNLIVVSKRESQNIVKNKKNIDYCFKNYTNKLDTNITKINEICSNYYNQNKKICLWGAGSSGSTVFSFYNIPVDYVDFIIDSDPNKWGMEYINHSIPIISPKDAYNLNPDLIIISSMYSQTIQKTITDNGFQSSVLSLFPNLSYIPLDI